MKTKQFPKRSLLALLALLPLGLMAQPTSVSRISPTPGTVFENQVGQSLEIAVTFSGGTPSDSDVLYLSWTNPDSPLLNEILLDAEEVSYDSDGNATMTYTFPGSAGYLDSTGTYSFHTWSDAAPAVEATFSYSVPENGIVPTVSLTYPASGATFLPGETITITAEAHDGDGSITKVEFLMGNNTNTNTGDEAYSILDSVVSAPYSADFTIPGVGEYKLSARAFDDRGNSGRSQIVSIFGSQSPVLQELTSITMLTPQDGATLSCTNPITLSVDVQPAALRSMVTVDYFVDGYKINSGPVTALGITDTFNYSWTLPYIGTHSITARAQLSNGTYVQTSNAADVTIVGIGSAPQVTLSVPDGDHRVVGSNARFYVHAGDSGALINTLYFYVNGVIYDTITNASALASFPYTFDFHFPAAGPYEIWVLAESSLGNRAISNVIEMEIDLGDPPSVAIISPVEGTQFLPGTNLPILVRANDPNSLIDTIQYFVNDTLIATGTRQTNGSFLVNNEEASHYTYYFEYAGDYRLYAQAMDESGIISQSNIVNIQVREPDMTKPQVVMSHPLPVGGGDSVNDVSIGSSMFLNAIATDGDGQIKYVNFYINGQIVGSSVTNFRDTFSLYFKPTTVGNYIVFAEAVDNDGNRTHSVPLLLYVYGMEAQLPLVSMLPQTSDVVDAGTQITLRAIADGGIATINQINFYVNGVLIGGDVEADADGVYDESIVLSTPGTYFLNARALEINPLGLTTDNWVVSDPIAIKVESSSSNRGFVIQTYEDIVGSTPAQTVVDQQVVSLDNGQKTQAQYVYELMQRDDFLYTEHALMARYLLAGAWPNRSVLMLDRSTIDARTETSTTMDENLEALVQSLLLTFQLTYWDGRRIPDSFSSDDDFEEFADILFNRKYGQNPTSAQTDRMVRMLRFYEAEQFLSDFIKDNEAIVFGSETRSTLLAIPNPPNTRLLEYARAASLFIDLLRVTPSADEVQSLAGLPLIQQIETILADPRFTSR